MLRILESFYKEEDIKEKICQEYKRWLNSATEDNDLKNELIYMRNDPLAIEDAFCCDLQFGTGGLRGIIGAGTNRMNLYTVAKASQGVANFIKKHEKREKWKIAISYDSRLKSTAFAKVAAEVFAANEFQVYIYSELMPTPCLSFAVRYLQCAAGVMVTASHNSSQYNGYKVYRSDGCQITPDMAAEISAEIGYIDIFKEVLRLKFESGLTSGSICYISENVIDAYINEVKRQSMLGNKINKDIYIIYSPLNGAGLRMTLRSLKESGYTHISLVKEQENPDGCFPTCPYPNPEVEEAMALGIQYANRQEADLFLATDPDCDRVGVAIKNRQGRFFLLSGNEIGVLLLEYICSRRIEDGTMPEYPIMIKTIVSTDMAEQIAENYGVRTIHTLTGFKFIGEQIGKLEAIGEEDRFIFGFEESHGYLSGSYVRDKDAVSACLLICEMFAYYRDKGMGLWDKLQELYQKYGYRLNRLHTYIFEGVAGHKKMIEIMEKLRESFDQFEGIKIKERLDYAVGVADLPRSNVIKFLLEGECSVVIRPSGTEPKMKLYTSVCAKNIEDAESLEQELVKKIEMFWADKI